MLTFKILQSAGRAKVNEQEAHSEAITTSNELKFLGGMYPIYAENYEDVYTSRPTIIYC